MEQKAIDQKIKKISDKIVKEFQPEKIILFGSCAWGKPHEWSDIDLLIVKRSDKPRIDRQRELRKMLFPPGVALDLLVYTPEELEKSINQDHNLFLEDIIRNGKVLYTTQKSEIRVLHKCALTVLA